MSQLSDQIPALEWLTPSAALSRFQASEADTDAVEVLDLEQLRYGAHIGAIGILLPGDKVSEVLEREQIFPIPNTASWLEGLINLRGNLVPIFDLKELLESERDADRKPMLLVIDQGEHALGLAIDGVPVPAAAGAPMTQLPPLPGAIKGFVSAAYVDGDEVWVELDVPRLVESLAGQISA